MCPAGWMGTNCEDGKKTWPSHTIAVLHYKPIFTNLYPFLNVDLKVTPQIILDLKVTPQMILGSVFLLVFVKVFASILNQRLLELVTFFDHKPQTDFSVNNETADHVFTLRTLVDKYVKCHQKKVYACFVDLRKAFGSVWLYELLNE